MFVLLGSIPPASGDAPISIRFADRAANRNPYRSVGRDACRALQVLFLTRDDLIIQADQGNFKASKSRESRALIAYPNRFNLMPRT
jgi:hypothetical protein